MAAGAKSVATAFAIQIGLAIAVFLLFSFLRIAKFARRFYAPKRFDKTLEFKPRRLPPGLFSWMWTVYTYPEEEVIKVAGLDSAMYLRVLQFGCEVFFKVAMWCLIVILPINLTGDQVESLIASNNQPPSPPAPPPPVGCPVDSGESDVSAKKYEFTQFDRCSMANLEAGSPKLWAHLVSIYVITYFVLTTLWRYNKEASLLRIMFLANSPRGGASHTTLITDVPGMRYGTIIWYLRGFVGSTLFVMLPGPWRKRILDLVEDAFGAVNKGLDAGAAITGPRSRRFTGGSDDDAASQPTSPPNDAWCKAAAANAAAAEEARMSKDSPGMLRRRTVANPRASVSMEDDSLDVWAQAGQHLGDAAEPRAHAVKGFIHDEMEFSYGTGSVASVNPVWDQTELEPLLAEYKKIRQLLEDHLDKMAYMLRRRKPIKQRLVVTVIGPTMGAWGIEKYGMKPCKVDAIEFWTDRLRQLSVVIPDAQQRCRKVAIPAAFVTFNTRQAQVHASTALHHHDETSWIMQPAPDAGEVIWRSLRMRAWERSVRTLLLWGAYLVMMLFYIIPIGAVQALIEVPKLADLPVLGVIVTLPFVRQILEAIVPGLVLVIFLALLPAVLALMCRLSGFVSTSSIDFGVVTRYFYFQLVSLFFGSIIAGSLLTQLRELVKNPNTIITILGVGIPMTATFFITYLLVAGIGKTGIKHLRIPNLVMFWLFSKMASTPRARARLWSDQYTQYGPLVPTYTIAFLLGLVYCCINPIICPVVLLFFSFSIISERYNNLYVFKREYESGGRLWFYVFNQFIVGVYMMQVIMLILFAIKKFKLAVLLLPSIFITFTFHVACLVLFRRPWSVLSAHDAAMLDRKDAEERGGEELSREELREIKDMYLSPVFKFTPEEIEPLLREAAITSRRINGEKLEDIEAELEESGYASAEEELSETEAPPAVGGGVAPVPDPKPLALHHYPSSSLGGDSDSRVSPAPGPTGARKGGPGPSPLGTAPSLPLPPLQSTPSSPALPVSTTPADSAHGYHYRDGAGMGGASAGMSPAPSGAITPRSVAGPAASNGGVSVEQVQLSMAAAARSRASSASSTPMAKK